MNRSRSLFLFVTFIGLAGVALGIALLPDNR